MTGSRTFVLVAALCATSTFAYSVGSPCTTNQQCQFASTNLCCAYVSACTNA